MPRPYDRLIPRRLGPPRPWVLASGAAELAAGVALLAPHAPRLRRAGARAAALLFIAVFPGNLKLARDTGPPRTLRELLGRRGVAWARLPLQAPLVWWAWRLARALPDHHRKAA